MTFELHVYTASDGLVVFGGLAADDAVEWIRAFVHRAGAGMRIMSGDCGTFFWPWDDVLACTVMPSRKG